jgi:uncharacterized damage-inducible protein DinB
MKSSEAIKISIDTADMIARGYIGDLTDEEMMHRPSPGCNHIKWQLGHVIGADHEMVSGCCPGAMPDLPAGFAEKYAKETATMDDPNAFDSKEDLLKLFDQQRAAALAALAQLSEADLDKPAPEKMRDYAPNVASVFSMLGIHLTMHSGQWAVIRRQLGRAPMF